MMRVERTEFGGTVGEAIIVELTTPESALLARDAARLHEAERTLAASFPAAARRDSFLAGRLAVHAALAEHGDSRANRMPILRDPRGRPQPSWADAPSLSIAHTRIRAVAAVSTQRSCKALGIDVEEIDRHRAEALLRMAISADERSVLAAVDPSLLIGPIALWCAREACVKTHDLQVGWFGSVLRVQSIEPVEPRVGEAEASWDLVICYESRPPMTAHVWQSHGALFALSAR